MTSVLVTGADGFIGRAVCKSLISAGFVIRCAVRNADKNVITEGEVVETGDIGRSADLLKVLKGMEAVIHLAGRAHVLKETAMDPLSEFRRVNVAGTEKLAREAANSGVKRFVYVSSIGVNGNYTEGKPFTELDPPNPHDAYTFSKWEAEQVLRRIASETGLEAVIVRPPLVYGPNVPGNFFSLLNYMSKGLPVPLKSVKNMRSFIYVENLADFLIRCMEDPKAAGETFLISDGEDVSTPELMRRMANMMDKPCRLFPLNRKVLRLCANVLGKGDLLEKICASLQVDIDKARKLLNWSPPVSAARGLNNTVSWYLNN